MKYQVFFVDLLVFAVFDALVGGPPSKGGSELAAHNVFAVVDFVGGGRFRLTLVAQVWCAYCAEAGCSLDSFESSFV